MATLKELLGEAKARRKMRDAAQSRLDEAVDSLNEERAKRAVEIAKAQLGIVVGAVVENSEGHLLRVEGVRARLVGEFQLSRTKATITANDLTANVVRLNRATGAPVSVGIHKTVPVITISGLSRLKVIPADQVITKRKKAEKSDAIKKLEKLSPEQLEQLMKKAGIKQ